MNDMTASETARLPPTLYQLKESALCYAGGDLSKAKDIFNWLSESIGEAGPAPGTTATPKTARAKKTEEAKGDTGVVTPPKETPAPDTDSPVEITMDYGKDVRPKVIAAAGRLAKTMAPEAAREEILKVARTFRNAAGEQADIVQNIRPEDWPALIAAVEKLGVEKRPNA